MYSEIVTIIRIYHKIQESLFNVEYITDNILAIKEALPGGGGVPVPLK